MTTPQTTSPEAVVIEARADDPTLTRAKRAGGPEAILPALPPLPLVSVVMTTFNSERLVLEAIESLLVQSYANFELIVVDDGSTDSTQRIVAGIAARDRRVRLVSFGVNRGTYWAKNFGILLSKGPVVTFMDSDDFSSPDRLIEQLTALRSPGVVVTTSLYRHVFEDGTTVERKRGAFITQMVRREVFDAIGYFDCVRTSADDEFLLRIKIVFGAAAHVNVNRFLYDARVREGSLSRDPQNPKKSSQTGGLSPARRHYIEACRKWHARCVSVGRRPYSPFPLVRRPFEVDPLLRMNKGASDASSRVTAVIDGRGGDDRALNALLQSLDGVIDDFIVVGQRMEVEQPHRIAWVDPPTGGDGLAWLEGVAVASGFVLVLEAAATYSPRFVSNQVMLVELLAREVVVGLSWPASRELEWSKSLWMGSLALHTDLVGGTESGVPLRLDPHAIERAGSVQAGILLPHVRFPAPPAGQLRQVALSGRAGFEGIGKESELKARVRMNARSFTDGLLAALFEPDGRQSKTRAEAGDKLPTLGAGSRSSPWRWSPHVRDLLGSMAGSSRRGFAIFLSLWSAPEKLLLLASTLLGVLVLASVATSVGLLVAVVLAMVVTFFGATLAFLARRVRIAALGHGDSIPARVRLAEEVRFARTAWNTFRGGVGSP